MDKYSSFNLLGTYEQAGVDYRMGWSIGNSRIAILSTAPHN